MKTEWKEYYMDMIFVPLGFLFCLVYHAWLWRMVKTQPQKTDIGINCAAQRLWVITMRKENNKKNMLVVQSIRNAIMSSTLMATTSILLCTGLAAIISSTYSVKKPLEGTLYGAHSDLIVSFKFVSLLFIFLLSFLYNSLSIRLMHQVSFLINIPIVEEEGDNSNEALITTKTTGITTKYLCEALEKGYILHIIGNRLFYFALPLLVWIYGPLLVCICYVIMMPILYNSDIVHGHGAEEHEEKFTEEEVEVLDDSEKICLAV